MAFAHLHVHSCYSLLDGANTIEELVRRAASLGMPALALTDHNSVAGAVKFERACRQYGLKPILGAEVTLEDDSHLTLLCQNPTGYASLCQLLTRAFDREERVDPRLPPSALASATGGLLCLTGCRRGRVSTLIRDHRFEEAEEELRRLISLFEPGSLYVELQEDFIPRSHQTALALAALARKLSLPVVATNNVHYATPEDAITHEVLSCIKTGSTVEQAAPGRPFNDQRYLKSEAEMAELFAWRPEAVTASGEIAARCEPALPTIEDVTPQFAVPEGFADAESYLRRLVEAGARERYGKLTGRIRRRLEHELAIICALQFVDYFLMVWSVVRWARSRGILATGRGSAADSCVAYCLRLTDVDVLESDLPFARFLTPGKLPDIDMDFPSDRRDEVFEHVKQTYGTDDVAMVCAWSTFRAKSAVRDVGKALGLPAEVLEFGTDHLSHFASAKDLAGAFERLPELKPFQHLAERFALLFKLCAKIANHPRHIVTHSSGIVISRAALSTLSPLQRSAKGLVRIMQFDKDDAEDLRLIKFDVLALRMLSAVTDAESSIQKHAPSFTYDRIPFEDSQTFELLRAGQAVGVFQYESPAQMALALTVLYTSFWDLVCAVALIRPGPVAGEGVSRYIACRNGYAPIEYLHPALKPVLERTLGCVVFQEQVIGVVAAMVGCTDALADKFRKSLARHDRQGTMDTARRQFVRAALRCHPELHPGRANAIFDSIKAWHGYGFTEGHAHSFAITGWKSAYLSTHHPAAYFAGLMSNQPMGFYSANTLAGEARRRGIQVYPVDINQSEDKCSTPTDQSIRLGLRLVAEIREDDIERIIAERAQRPFTCLLDFCTRVVVSVDVIENLILCGAFDCLHEHRRGLLWRLRETMGLALLCRREAAASPQARLLHVEARELDTPVAWELDDFSDWDKFLWSWRIVGVTAEAHVFAYLRDALNRFRILTADEAVRQPAGTVVTVAGLNIRPHTPPTRSKRRVLFTTIEDNTGYVQAICTDQAIERYIAVFLTAPVVLVRGVITRKGRGVMLKVQRAKPLRMQEFLEGTPPLAAEPPTSRSYPGTRLSERSTAKIA